MPRLLDGLPLAQSARSVTSCANANRLKEFVLAAIALPGEDRFVRTALAALALVGVASVVAVAALAGPTANGLPTYTDGYARWTKLNRRPVTTPGAHNGVKNVYASRKRLAGAKFPNGTVIVKSISRPGAAGPPAQVAVMRKVAGRWRWVEYERSGSRYAAFASGQICTGCHVQARANDWVFTRR
jgi:Cytochrome P460